MKLFPLLAAAMLTTTTPSYDYPSGVEAMDIGNERRFANHARLDGTRDRGFVFCTLQFRRDRSEPSGSGWKTDFPLAGQNFSRRIFELTTAHVTWLVHPQMRDFHVDSPNADGRNARNSIPLQYTVSAFDEGDGLSTCPIVFTSDVGTLRWRPGEAERMRDYLLKGGVLFVDDFWGDQSWAQWTEELAKVLDPRKYPIVDLPDDHPLLTEPYRVGAFQNTNISRWKGTGGGTSEQGQTEAHYAAVFDERGGLMVFIVHGSDLMDTWEREADDGFFAEFASQGYGVGLNIFLHVMAH